MTLSYKNRRRLSLLVLLVWLPAYVIGTILIMTNLPRLPFLAEMLIYIALGFLWMAPFRTIFRGVGQPDPAATPKD
ncbi:MAG: DUF2842 domain-containing protein [Paracoccaceae bacterium]|jgi:predicted membrane channel-forming protein YqfA (hemolysin III family)